MNTVPLVIKLKDAGWTEIQPDWEYRKGHWILRRDTSSWWELGSVHNPRIFDIHEPGEHEAPWTTNLIEHLCMMEDERFRFRAALTQIEKEREIGVCNDLAVRELNQCYHKWLLDSSGKTSCPICGKQKD